MRGHTRRQVVRALGVGAIASLAGCSLGSGDVPDGDVEVHTNYFEPESYTVEVGETVTWAFAADSHNVCGDPDDYGDVSIPDGADPFASYDGDNTSDTISSGETYEHTFETPGEYHYVCVPHATVGMQGDIVVEESSESTEGSGESTEE